jgi:hypothetical protein
MQVVQIVLEKKKHQYILLAGENVVQRVLSIESGFCVHQVSSEIFNFPSLFLLSFNFSLSLFSYLLSLSRASPVPDISSVDNGVEKLCLIQTLICPVGFHTWWRMY